LEYYGYGLLLSCNVIPYVEQEETRIR
jgi:hypothetical protein